MALYQPVFVTPDVRSGIGNGVVNTADGMTVSWHINGPSEMKYFQITIFTNDSASTQKYTTGKISTGCPAYGTTSTGEPQFFSYKISASTLSANTITNGNEYKLIIKQWWSSSESVTQRSASVFVTRAAPALSIDAIGTSGVISTRYYSFSGTYSQAQSDVLNWFRWQIAEADATDNPFFDSGKITGTMDIGCYYDGFFADTSYAVRLTAQTENGVEADTGWVGFSTGYTVIETSGEVQAGCVGGTDAVFVEWSGIGYIPGMASGPYTLQGGEVSLPADSSILWNYVGTGAMSFAAPWSVVWRGKLDNYDCDCFTIGQSTGDVALTYDGTTHVLTLSKGGTALVTQSGIINQPIVTVVLTATNLYLRAEYLGGALYPAEDLYPGSDLYPADNTIPFTDVYDLPQTYTQAAITSVAIGGYQVCDFVQVIMGAASAAVIDAAITTGGYEPEQSNENYMMATFDSDIAAGTLDIGDETVQGFSLYRRQGTENSLVHIADVADNVSYLYDYSATSQQGPYVYYLFLQGANTYLASPLQSGMIFPCWWNWTLMECEETSNDNIYTVLAAYRFRLNVESGAVSNNNQPGVMANFTRYPKIQLAPQNYRSGTLGGLIGAVDWTTGQPEYRDTIEWRDALYALSTSQNPLFLKNRKGDLIRIRLSAPIVMTTDDKTRPQAQTISLPWIEVGSADGVSLYSAEFAGVQSAQGAFIPQAYQDTSDATATERDLKIAETAYARGKKLTGEAVIRVSGTTLIMPEW